MPLNWGKALEISTQGKSGKIANCIRLWQLLQQQSLKASIGNALDSALQSPAVLELELPPTLLIRSASAA